MLIFKFNLHVTDYYLKQKGEGSFSGVKRYRKDTYRSNGFDSESVFTFRDAHTPFTLITVELFCPSAPNGALCFWSLVR